jgi:predicted nucleotidyltransferase
MTSAGVTRFGNFRSLGRPPVARCVPDSDIDLLVEFLPDAAVGSVEHAGLTLDLQQLLGRKVDLVSKNGLKPRIRPYILADAQLVYAA